MSADYRVRPATLADVDALVRHRIGMFTDMGVPMDAAALGAAFRAWLADMMPAGTYRGWLAETYAGEVVSGGGITVLPWPPGPRRTVRGVRDIAPFAESFAWSAQWPREDTDPFR